MPKRKQKISHKADSQAMMEGGEKRDGSDSDAHKHRKGSRLHEKAQREPASHPRSSEDYSEDLNPDEFAGENHGQAGRPVEYGLTAYDIKDVHNRLAGLTNDELKAITILPLGSDLEQGAKYIDLLHLEQGEFVGRSGMIAEEDHYYVPKKETDYLIWNRLNQVDTPERLDNLP